jgi:hypothetical protein
MMQKKIFFSVEQHEEGYPPVTTESVWAEETEDGNFVIDNIPFFATAATLGDIVNVDTVEGQLYYKSTVKESDNSLLRVILFEQRDPSVLRSHLAKLGCATEGGPSPSLIAVNVPGTVSLQLVITVLKEGFDNGYWDYEEAILRQ